MKSGGSKHHRCLPPGMQTGLQILYQNGNASGMTRNCVAGIKNLPKLKEIEGGYSATFFLSMRDRFLLKVQSRYRKLARAFSNHHFAAGLTWTSKSGLLSTSSPTHF